MRRTLLAALLPLLVSLAPQPRDEAAEQPGDPWAGLRPLVGTWKGTSDGKFGKAEVEKTYALLWDGAFLQCRTRSVSAREVHEDLGMWSWDKERECFVLREFHSEGYVNRYAADVLDDPDGGKTLVLETEAVENGFAPGLRAQTTIRFESPDEVRETFCLATGDRPFETCVEMRLERVE